MRNELNIATGEVVQIAATPYLVNGVWTLIDDGQPVPSGAVLASTIPMPEVVAEPPLLTTQQIAKFADFLKTNPDIAEAFGV